MTCVRCGVLGCPALVIQCLLRSKSSCCVCLQCFDIYLVWSKKFARNVVHLWWISLKSMIRRVDLARTNTFAQVMSSHRHKQFLHFIYVNNWWRPVHKSFTSVLTVDELVYSLSLSLILASNRFRDYRLVVIFRKLLFSNRFCWTTTAIVSCIMPTAVFFYSFSWVSRRQRFFEQLLHVKITYTLL